jgi:hypothetical protein
METEMKLEYMCKDVSSVELGQLGKLIGSLAEQGWQPLDESETRTVPAQFELDRPDAIHLWMKRRCPAGSLAAAA